MPETDKRYPATPHRRREARQKGQVAKSIEINTAVVLFGGFIVLRFVSAYMFTNLKDIVVTSFTFIPQQDISMTLVLAHAPALTLKFLMMIAPVLLAIAVIAVLANILQIGFLTSNEAIKPQLNRLNPINGFKRIFSARALVELFKSLMKISVTAAITYAVIRSSLHRLVYMIAMEPQLGMSIIGQIVFSLIAKLCTALGGIAVLDYLYQRWEHERSLRMTHQELKEEIIRYEGRPEVKQRIKTLQRQYATRRMMQEVPKADVVVTNPTHLAVAIMYDPKHGTAPMVVAKGARNIAEKIIALAKEHGVPVVENKPLAQMLFKMVEIGKMIPVTMYQAVAEVLAYLYRLGKLKKRWN
ncbi:MAG: flagellar biosynthesis protein FlhB [Candidatus Omnitrophica bacterium]|nr:flagellar biosynthesis protein FlhB [Candidatus Omnitrophota bacterium]